MAGERMRQRTHTNRRTGTAINRTKGLSFVAAPMAFAVALTVAPAAAQETETGTEAECGESPVKEIAIDERLAELQQRMDSARARLQLSDEQVELLLTVLMDNMQATVAVLQEHGIDLRSLGEGDPDRRMNLRQLRALGSDLDEARQAMFEKIEDLGFLSDEQFAEFKKIQEEQRAVLRERLRARQGGV